MASTAGVNPAQNTTGGHRVSDRDFSATERQQTVIMGKFMTEVSTGSRSSSDSSDHNGLLRTTGTSFSHKIFEASNRGSVFRSEGDIGPVLSMQVNENDGVLSRSEMLRPRRGVTVDPRMDAFIATAKSQCRNAEASSETFMTDYVNRAGNTLRKNLNALSKLYKKPGEFEAKKETAISVAVEEVGILIGSAKKGVEISTNTFESTRTSENAAKVLKSKKHLRFLIEMQHMFKGLLDPRSRL